MKRIVTLPLPGDADTVLECSTNLAIRRDNRLNNEEVMAYWLGHECARARVRRPWERCTRRDPCAFCYYLKVDV